MLMFWFSIEMYLTRRSAQVVPYTECEMGMEPQEYTTSVLEPKLFVEKTCNQVGCRYI